MAMAVRRNGLFVFLISALVLYNPSSQQGFQDTRSVVISLLENGDAKEALTFLESQYSSPQREFEDGYTPSLFYYAGIASQLLGDLEAAAAAFTKAVQYDKSDVQSWMNLGDVFLYQYDGERALVSFEEALYLSGGNEKAPANVLAKVHRAHSWTASWSHLEVLTLELRERLDTWFEDHIKKGNVIKTSDRAVRWNSSICVQGCIRLPVMPADFGDFSPKIQTVVTPLQPQADPTLPPGFHTFSHQTYKRVHRPTGLLSPLSSVPLSMKPLHVGFLSSDFGVHPVSSLIRGFLKHLQQARNKIYYSQKQAKQCLDTTTLLRQEPALEVSCWLLTDDISWWRSNISAELGQASNGQYVNLHGLSHSAAAQKIKNAGVDVLVDLNGHTRGSGLPLMRLRPAKVQISWLGYPATTGASFIDYYLCDMIACDPLASTVEFTEKMIYFPMSYIVNDHANMLGHSLVPTLAPNSPKTVSSHHSSLQQLLSDRSKRRESSGFQDVMRSVHSERVTKNKHDNLLFQNRWYHQDGSLKEIGPILASFSNWMKMDPTAMDIWCNVMTRSPNAYLWIQAAELAHLALPNLRQEMAARGVFPGRMFATPQQPWIHHVTTKTAADLILDTPLKNQHSTSLDALWGGAPLITIAGDRAARRAGASLLRGLGGEAASVGRVYSLKEYEEIASKLANDEHLLSALRRSVAKSRTACGGLFDSYSTASDFYSLMHTAVEVSESSHKDTPGFSMWLKGRSTTKAIERPCISSSLNQSEEGELSIPVFTALDPTMVPTNPSQEKHSTTNTPTMKNDSQQQTNKDTKPPLLLNIGGRTAREGWTIVNIMESETADAVDVLARMDDLQMYEHGSVTAVYASHVLEHASYMRSTTPARTEENGSSEQDQRLKKLGVFANGEVGRALSEWFRILIPGGALFLAVPDMDVLANFYLNETLSSSEKFYVMRMIFGGQTDGHDFHYTGFDEVLIAQLLTAVGFCEVRRVPSFNLFEDTSQKMFKGVPISLNIVATACKSTSKSHARDGVSMGDHERVYISIPGRTSPEVVLK